MVDPIQISELPIATEVNDSDLLIVRQGGEDKQLPASVLFATALLAENNLSDVGNVVASRTSLDVPATSDVLLKANSLSDLPSVGTARVNLDVPSIAQVLLATNALSELTGVASTARSNLSVPEASTVLLASANLSDLTDVEDARTALGVSPTEDVLLKTNNLSDVDAEDARDNLDVSPTSDVVLRANNLSDVNAAAARVNLDVPALSAVLLKTNNLSELTPTASTVRSNLSVPSTSEVLLKSSNLADLTDPSTARSNLSVPSTAEVLLKSSNLSDLASTSTARTNLGLGNLATQNAGSGLVNSGSNTNLSFTSLTEDTTPILNDNYIPIQNAVGTITKAKLSNIVPPLLTSSQTASNSAYIEITMDGSSMYEVIGEGIRPQTADGTGIFLIRLSTAADNYSWSSYYSESGVITPAGNNNDVSWRFSNHTVSNTNLSSYALSFKITIPPSVDSGYRMYGTASIYTASSGNVITINFSGWRYTGSSVLRFLYSNANIGSGTFLARKIG